MEMYYFASYLTDAALLPTAIVALVLNVPSVVDFIFSLLNGVILEKAHLPIGKYRFWLIVGPIIAVITYALVFVRYRSDLVCAVALIILICLAHFFWSMAETAYNALPTLLTDDAGERPSLPVFIAATLISAIISGVGTMPLLAMYADCADFGAYKTGVEAKGFVMSLYNVPVKISLLIKGVVVSVILAAIRYDALATDAASLSAYATGFNNGYFGFAAVMTILGIVILAVGYHLSEKKVAECISEMEQRRQSAHGE